MAELITFNCESCGIDIRVMPKYGGKKTCCPNCRSVVVVPAPDDHRVMPTLEPKVCIEDKELYSTPDYEAWRQTQIPDTYPKRPLPWFVDIFVYPCSISGMANLCIFWFLPILIGLIPPVNFLSILLFIAELIVAGYMYHFLLECIRDSASGGIRAPTNIGSQVGGLRALASLWQIVVTFVVFWGPLVACLLYVRAQSFDPWASPLFWAALAYALIFFPVGTLAIAIMDLADAFNPWLWVKAMFRAPLEYGGLVLGCAALFLILYGTGVVAAIVPFIGLLIFGIDICLLMILSHLIGRFYYRNAAKLGWE
jgi:hypothetical protein